ncbi:unnamed protein product [Sympodiomycopsis kandeliae]
MSGVRSMSAIPPEELPILESLISIRNRLTALKKNSSEYVRAQDVQTLYQAVIKQVSKLNAIRDEREATNSPAIEPSVQESSSGAGGSTGPSGPTPSGSRTVSSSSFAARSEVDASTIQTNRVDTTLQDVFSLLSLFFLTIGKSRETPATFSQLASMKQLLDHLAESGIYTEADLQPFEKRLAELRAIIRKDTEQGKHPTQLTKLMMRKLEGCEKVLQQLQGTLSVLSVELVPIHQKLVSIRRQIAAAAAKPKPARGEIRKLQEELRAIDGKRVDGKFLGPGGSSVPAGQAILVGLLEECFEICHDVVIRNDEVPMTLQPIYDRLTEIKGQLEHLVLTHRWTLRETDLWNYQVTLKEIDRLRVDGKFVDSEGKQPEGQLVLLYLLRRCYGLIYRLVASSEPISEELMPISNKLSTVSKCLKEVSKYGGPFTMRDLYPYRLALHQVENMKSPVLDKDGNETGTRKWLGRDGSVPEGQAILRAQFEEVEQTINEMLNQDDESDEDDEDGLSGSDWGGSQASETASDPPGDGDEYDDDDLASVSAGVTSGLHSRDISMPASPAGDSAMGSVLSFSGLASPSDLGNALSPPLAGIPATPQSSRMVAQNSQEITPTNASASVLQTFKAQASPSSPSTSSPSKPAAATAAVPTTASSLSSSPTAQVLAGMSTSPLPPGAATLAVPVPNQQNSLTAAAVRLDSVGDGLIGQQSPQTVSPPGAEPGTAQPIPIASAAGVKSALSDTSSLSSTTTAPGAGGAGRTCQFGFSSSSSPGGTTGQETKEELAKQLEAKLALESA